MNPRTRSRTPASIGSNQASPLNSSLPSVSAVVLFCPMAWSPPALERRSGALQRTGDYAASRFHHFRDGTQRLIKWYFNNKDGKGWRTFIRYGTSALNFEGGP